MFAQKFTHAVYKTMYKIIIGLFLLTALLLMYSQPALAVTNSYAIDLERSSSQYLSAADDAALDISGDYTIELWYKPESFAAAGGFLIAKGTSDNSMNYRIAALENGDIDFYRTTNAGAYQLITTSGPLTKGEWSHIAVVSDVSVGAKIYVDGTLVTSDTRTAATHDTNADEVLIGARKKPTTAQDFADGIVDEVRIWNDIRTQSEIEDNMFETVSSSASGLVAYWQLENNLNDETSNGNDLTNNGSASFDDEGAHQFECALNYDALSASALTNIFSCSIAFFN